MEPYRGLGHRGALLPYEVDICETLGITAEEYLEFFAAAFDYVEKRKDEYEQVPDVVNGPATPILVNLVIGIALTAIGALLAPKPRSLDQRRPKSLNIPGEQGRTRYSKSSNFDSVQQLAALGRVIPLVFADRKGDIGGVRVDTDLLHSQLLTAGASQIFTGVFSLGLGKIGDLSEGNVAGTEETARPDFDGFAIGDLLLRDFSPYKLQLYFANRMTNKLNGNRIKNSDIYVPTNKKEKLDLPSDTEVSDAFSVFIKKDNYQPWFSGARTPSTKTQFGAYSPISNGHVFYVPYELVLRVDGSGSKAKNSASEKRRKIIQVFSRYSGIRNSDVSAGKCKYRIKNGKIKLSDYDFDDHGVSDVNNFLQESRITADEALQESEQYLVGETLATCVQRPTQIWSVDANNDFVYTLRFDEPIKGVLPSVPDVDNEKPEFGARFPWTGAVVMRAAIGSITNSRPCEYTQIGIKSEVWRQMTNSANFQAHPNLKTINKFEEKGGQITLGTVTKYMSRWSFFRLEARELGSNTWIQISDQPFAVNGTTPTAQYNTIVIKHPTGQSMHEYRFVPVPGSRFYNTNGVGKVYHLKGSFYETSNYAKFSNGGYVISYTGEELTLTTALASNVEWVFGGDKEAFEKKKIGPLTVNGLDDFSTQNTSIPTKTDFVVDPIGKYSFNSDPRYKTMVEQIGRNEWVWYWRGSEIRRTFREDQRFIKAVEQGTNVRYEWEKLKEEQRYSEGKWFYNNTPYLVYSYETYAGPMQNKQFKPTSCVIFSKLANQYEYWFGGNLIQRKRNLDGYVSPGDDTRYEAAKDLGRPETKEYKDDDNRQKMYEKDRSNLITGARLTSNNGVPSDNSQENQYTFYYQGKELGTSRGGDIYLRVESNPAPGRWRIVEKMQDYKTSFYRFIGSFRRLIYNDPPLSAKNSVETGVVQDVNGLYDWYHEGERIVGDTTNANGPWYSSNKQYRYTRDTDAPPRFAGKNNRPVWKLKVEVLEDINKREQWAISFKYELVTPELYPIKLHRLIGQQTGQYAITRRYETTNPVEEEPKGGQLVKVTATKRKDQQGEDKATVKVKTYYDPNNPSKIAHQEWTLESFGDNYIRGEEVQIGSKNSIGQRVYTTVADVVDPDFDEEDRDKSWDEFVEPDNGPRNYFPLNAISDYFINNTDRSSHQNAPEHEIAFVNELIKPESGDTGAQYNQMALVGLKITNSKEWSNLSNLSAYISKGLRIERLFARDGIAAGLERPSNLFPEIAYALLTDPLIGAGTAIGAEAVDKEAMTVAARFCHANGFHWDGVIGEQENLREFIFEQAAYCMLDFTIKGGRFALYPAVPFGGQSFKILTRDAKKNKAKPTISALFTDGNIRNMEVSFLQPEERQPFQAAVLYRKEKLNGFSQTRTKIIRLKGGENDPVEQFDLTQFCTSENHAVLFAKYALATRMYVTHGIKFETTPTAAAGLEPGQYIRIATTVTHTPRSRSGSIDSKGYIQSATPLSISSFPILFWKPDTTEIRPATLEVTFESANEGVRTRQESLHGCLWCEQVDSREVRVYKVETIAFSDDGLVAISGSEAPLDSDGFLKTVHWDGDAFEEVA
jgi:hypothetical protein